MNERIARERARDAWLIVGGLSLLVVVVAMVLWRGQLVQSPEPTRPAITGPSASATALPALPTPIKGDGPSTPVVLGLTSQPKNLAMTGVAVGQLAPNFSLPTLGGDRLTLAERRGQPVLVNFWASWCGPCRLEMPALVRAYQQYHPDGLEIIGFNVTSQDSRPAVQSFVDEFSVPYPIVLDEAGHVTADDYQLRGLPMSLFINPDGTIARIQLGAMTETQIETFIQELLGE